MLVLTRREDQKVLFPNLGIAVEVVAIQGNTVRLGIDAPRDIRVVRSELELFPEPPESPANDSCAGKIPAAHELRNSLNAANMAIHLAQNQMQQGLSERAEEALDHALACLRAVDESWTGLNPGATALPDSPIARVQEESPSYAVASDTPKTGVLLVGPESRQRSRICDSLRDDRLANLIIVQNDEQAALKWLAETPDQPELMLVFVLHETV
ncbi:MAG: carbon storage regulator [Pirellulaceae bacterium]